MNEQQFQPTMVEVPFSLPYFPPNTPQNVVDDIIEAEMFPVYLKTLMNSGTLTATQAISVYSGVNSMCQPSLLHDIIIQVVKQADEIFKKQQTGLILPEEPKTNILKLA